MDEFTRKHLERWLEQYVRDDIRERVRELMLATLSEDEEYWLNRSWAKLYDQAIPQEVYNQLKADADLQADVDAMRGDV